MNDSALSSEGVFRLFVFLGFFCLASLTLLSFFGASYWVFEIFSQFRVQYAATAACMMILLALTGARRLEWILGAILLTVNALPIVWQLGIGVSAPAIAREPADLRLMTANLRYGYVDFDALEDFIQEQNPDVISLTEIWGLQPELSKRLAKEFPYRATAGHRGSSAMMVFSRHPFKKRQTHYLPGTAIYPVVDLDVCPKDQDPSRCFKVVTLHPARPGPSGQTDERNQVLALAAKAAADASNGQVVVMGDLNITQWSPNFSEFIENANLQSRSLHPLEATTWISRFPLFGLSIDHVLPGSAMKVVDRVVGPDIGSDHFPVVADLAFKG